MAGKISDLTAAVSALDANEVELLQSGANKRATVAMLRAASLPLAGGTLTGALTLSGAPTVDLHAATKLYVDGLIAGKQNLDATLTALAGLGAGPGFLQVTGQDAFSIAALSGAQVNTALGYTAANAASLNSSALTGALPAISGAALTNLPGGISGLTAGKLTVASNGTTIVNSMVTMSGANLGTATLYDDTAVTGITQSVVRAGSNQGANAIWQARNAANAIVGEYYDTGALYANSQVSVGVAAAPANSLLSAYLSLNQTTEILFSSGATAWPVTAGIDSRITSLSPGIIKAGDGSGGWNSGFRAGALGVQTANGAIANFKSISESITLNTGGTTTDSTADLLPANAEIVSVTARITTTIATATNWALGDATTSARFASANATLTAGTTSVGVNHRKGSVATDAAGATQGAAAKLRITTTGTPSAGVVRVTVNYWEHTPPTS